MPFFGVPIRNGLPIGLGSVAGFGVQQFDPFQLFEGGTVAGAWYDPSDLSTMFDTSAGTTPVAMPGQGAAVPVGLMLDKSQGLVLGPNLAAVLPTPTILDSGGSVGVWDGSTQTISSTTITAITNYPRYQFAIAGVTAGKNYQISVTATGTNLIRISNPSLGGVVLTANFASGTLSFIANNVASNVFQLVTDSRAVYSATLTVSIRELPGNHAISFNNTTARPELRARVNLVEYSEQFDNGYWTKSNATVTSNVVAAPNGTTTADKLIENTATDNHFVRPSSFVAGTYTFSCFLRQAERTWAVLSSLDSTVKRTFFDLSLGVLGTVSAGHTATIVPAGNGWYQCTITVNVSAVSNFFYIGIANADNGNSYTGNGTSGIYIWGADLRPANIGANVPAYQRIADANTYDTSGFPLYLRFDGIDDSMYTPANLNLSGTDKVAVFAGVRKLSDAAAGMVTELSATLSTNNGTFYIQAPQNGGNAEYSFASKGTTAVTRFTSTQAAPITNVVSGIGSISTPEATIRVDGVQISTSSNTQGTGNYGTYPLFIGARNNSSSRLNGHLYSLAVVGSAVSAGNIAAMESWVAGRTGIQI